MKEGTTHVGLDVHKASIAVCIGLPDEARPLELQVANQADSVSRLVKRLRKLAPGEVELFYEAGPCGFALHRRLNREDGFTCRVIAPSLIPRAPGERIKTDRRDGRKLMQLGRAGLLTEVHAPTPSDEALRDLSRARADAKRDLTRARQRMNALLLRHGRDFRETKSRWTIPHRRWLWSQTFDTPWAQGTFDNYLLAIEQAEARLAEMDKLLVEASETDPKIAEPVAFLRCFHGIDTVAAVAIVTELYAFERFTGPRNLMAFLGQVPSEHSSGGSRRQGGITKTGNGHVRRILIECAWAYRRKPRVGPTLRKRREGQPAWVQAIADKAHRRLYRRYWHLVGAGKHPNKATSAVARELAGFIWAVLTERIHRTGALAV